MILIQIMVQLDHNIYMKIEHTCNDLLGTSIDVNV